MPQQYSKTILIFFNLQNQKKLPSQVEGVDIRKDQPSTQEEQTDTRKDIMTDADFMIDHPNSCPHTLNILRKGVSDAEENALEYIENQRKGNGHSKLSKNGGCGEEQMV